MKGSGHGLFLRFCPHICLEELKETTENLSWDSWPLGQESNLESPNYVLEVLNTHAQHYQYQIYVCVSEEVLIRY
jgi:hypothetical protein